MADELGCNSALAIELLFEGEDNQHLADVLANALDAALLPSPQLRADVVDDGYVQLMEFASKAQVEVWEVDENGGIGTAVPGGADDLPESAIYARNSLDHFDNADLGDLAGVGNEFASGRAHPIAAHSEELELFV